MHSEDQNVVISWQDYFSNARNALLRECCAPEEALAEIHANAPITPDGAMVAIHLNTSGANNVISQYPGYKTLLKSVFLTRIDFRKDVIGYYRQLGYTWVDIVALNRDKWKIFLWKE